MSFVVFNNKKTIVNVQKETSKHTIIKGNCVFKRRDSLVCVGLLCERSCSFSFVPPKEAQHRLTSLFSSFIFQCGRTRSVTCQCCLYYFGESQEGKMCLGVFPYQWMLQCGLCSKKNVEISQVFLTTTLHISSTATCLSDGTQRDRVFFFFSRQCPGWALRQANFSICIQKRWQTTLRYWWHWPIHFTAYSKVHSDGHP